MKWNELEKEWQRVLELCWDAFCEGNLPIAAVIADHEGNILSTGKNNSHISNRFLNAKIDHAETECVQMLDVEKYPSVRDYILYTSMEPCPMCMGTIVMGNIRRVCIAARDPWAGATDLCSKSDYIASKHMNIRFMDEGYGMVSMTLLAYAELRSGRGDGPVLKKFETDYPEAVAAARLLYKDGILDRYAGDQRSIEEVFDHINYVLDAMITL